MRKLLAVLEISKVFVQGGGCTCTLSPSFMDEVLNEERASYNSLELLIWVGTFQAGIFRSGRGFPGENLVGGNFPRRCFQGDLPRTIKRYKDTKAF